MIPEIVQVITRYHPEWTPPADTGKEWYKTLCPFHRESHASATVSYDRECFNCRSCGVKGDIYSVIMHEEEVSFAQAKRRAATIVETSNVELREPATGVPRRRVFGESGFVSTGVRTRIRQRPAPWA